MVVVLCAVPAAATERAPFKRACAHLADKEARGVEREARDGRDLLQHVDSALLGVLLEVPGQVHDSLLIRQLRKEQGGRDGG